MLNYFPHYYFQKVKEKKEERRTALQLLQIDQHSCRPCKEYEPYRYIPALLSHLIPVVLEKEKGIESAKICLID